MRYLVVLDRQSTVGSVYANGTHDGLVNDGGVLHPALDCTEISFEGSFIQVTRDLTGHRKSHQTLYLPYSAVAFVQRYDESEPLEMMVGFTPPKVPA